MSRPVKLLSVSIGLICLLLALNFGLRSSMGFFMAPIYPVLNSVMLSALQKHQHAAMTGLIVVFSALGGTTGSVITGYVFEHFSGQYAFYLSLVPMSLIFISVIIFKKRTHAISQQAVD